MKTHYAYEHVKYMKSGCSVRFIVIQMQKLSLKRHTYIKKYTTMGRSLVDAFLWEKFLYCDVVAEEEV